MNRLKTILVGTDFSEGSRAAVQQAARMARWNGARLRMVHVLDSLAVEAYAQALREPLSTAAMVAGFEAGLPEWMRETQAPDAVDAGILVGHPLDTLLAQCEFLPADLLVLGLRGESGLAHGHGHLALKCLRKAGTKVLLVAEAHTGPFRTVVAGVDFSKPSREAVTQAMRVAREEEGAVHFVHVFTSPWRRGRRGRGRALREVSPEARKDYRAELYQRLRRFVAGAEGVRATITLVDAEDPGAGLAEYARKVQAGLVVVGRRGESNLNHLQLGSTVERLLPEISCSVLVVGSAAA